MTRLFARDPKWAGYQVALGAEEKTATLRVAKRTDLSSFLRPLKGDSEVECQVEMKRLDVLFPMLTRDIPSPRALLKMDTQGFEVEVFKGARGCLDSIVGLQSEISVKQMYENMPHYIETLTVFEAAGFELYNLSIVNRVFGKGLAELNCFMKKAASPGSKAGSESRVWLEHVWAGR